jgi:hypothetical protein
MKMNTQRVEGGSSAHDLHEESENLSVRFFFLEKWQF